MGTKVIGAVLEVERVKCETQLLRLISPETAQVD
jgi:hypothetical protein